MNVTVIKEGSSLRLLEASEAIPEGKILQLTSLPSAPPDDAREFSRLGLRSFFETTDDSSVNWEDYFELK